MIKLKTPDEIKKIKRSSILVAKILAELKDAVKPGITTLDLENMTSKILKMENVKGAFKGYKGFPCNLCTSINDEIVHGIPSKERVLNEGDIVSIDFGVIIDGYYGDAALTVPVGKVSKEAKSLMDVTQNSLMKGISKCLPGHKLGDVSYAIQNEVEANRYSVIRDFVGHGIGMELHEEPQVPNYGVPGSGIVLQEGMVLALEPMVSVGNYAVKILPDGWTAVTKDGKLAAHFEHTVAITSNGPEILTLIN